MSQAIEIKATVVNHLEHLEPPPKLRRSRTLLLGFAAVLLVGSATAMPGPDCPPEPDLTGTFQQVVVDIEELSHRGCLPAAHDLAEELLLKTEDDFGHSSDEVADVLEILADSHYWLRERNTKAIERIEASLRIRESARGHRILGSLLSAQEDVSLFREAWDHFERARELWEEELGFASVEIADLLNWIGELIDDWGVELGPTTLVGKSVRDSLEKATVALSTADRSQFDASKFEDDPALTLAYASATLAHSVGPESAEHGEALNILGNLLHDRQRYDEALTAYDESLQVRLRFFPGDHPQVARAYHNRGEALMLVGSLDQAWPDIKTGYDLRFAVADSRYPATFATSLRVLGQWLFFTGDLEGAAQHYREALPLLKRIYGNWRYAEGLMNLAELYEDLGETDKALNGYSEALEILAENPSANQIGRAAVQAKLGTLLVMDGKLEEGEGFLLAAQSGQQADRPPEDYAQTLRGLAEAERAQGQHARALELLMQARQVLEQYEGSHPELADTQLTIAEIQLLLKKTENAGQTLSRVERLLPTLGEAAYARPRYHLLRARAAVAGNRPMEALAEATRAAGLYARHLAPAFRVLSPDSALRYAHENRQSLNLALALLAKTNGGESGDPRPVARLWQTVARSRSLLVDEERRRYRLAREDSDPGQQVLLAKLDSARQFLAETHLRLHRISDDQEREALLRYAQNRFNEAYDALASTMTPAAKTATARHLPDDSDHLPDLNAFETVALPKLIGELPAKTALVSFVRFDASLSAAAQPPGSSAEAHYAAFVTTAGAERAVFIDLGLASTIDRQVDSWRKVMLDGAFDNGPESESKLRIEGLELRSRLWDPIARLAPETQRFFIVPDGSLFLIPFGALAGRAGDRYLIDEGYVMHRLVSERDLLETRRRNPGRERLLAVGDPDFDAGMSATVIAGLSRPSLLERVRDTASDLFRTHLRDPCLGQKSLDFLGLPHAGDEASRIATIFRSASNGEKRDVTMLLKAKATEISFTQLAPEHSVLHIATHAFLDLQCRDGTSYRGLGELLLDAPDKQRFVSGLAFAGANLYRLADDYVGASRVENDGILTVPEIAGLDLSGVDWVVLSACETAVGHVTAGEGLLGLARSFRVAGADTLIVSLWQVDDRATQEWMTQLYGARFEDQENTAGSLHSASLAVLKERRRAGKSTHPFFWAAFVAMGDWE